MRAGKLVLIAGLLAILACPVVARADISDYFDLTGKLNTVDFVNREVIIRGTAGNWTILNPNVSPIAAGDLVVSVFRGQDLTLLGSSTPAWTAATDGSSNQYFSGYGVQQVVFAGFGSIQYKNPTWDPFGQLNVAAGETLRLYEDPTDWVVDGNALSLATSVGSVTDGSLYAAFTMTGGYGNLMLATPTDGLAFAGLNNVAVAGSGASADGLTFVPYAPAPWASAADISARAVIGPNQNGPLGPPPPAGTASSPWYFESNGPMMFTAVPEPTTLAMGLGFLAIGAVVALRRRKK